MVEALTNNAVMNLLWHYSNWFDVWEIRPDLIEIFERYGHNKYYIYRKLCQFKNLRLTKEKCYTVEIPSKHKHTLLEDISKACFIKTKAIAKITEPINSKLDNEIIFF